MSQSAWKLWLIAGASVYGVAIVALMYALLPRDEFGFPIGLPAMLLRLFAIIGLFAVAVAVSGDPKLGRAWRLLGAAAASILLVLVIEIVVWALVIL